MALPEATSEQAISVAVEQLLRRPVRELKVIGRGGNSRVLLARCADSGSYVVKLYPYPGEDRRDRLGTEIRALNFLHRNRVHDVPEVAAFDEGRRLAVLEHIDGNPIPVGDVSDDLLDVAIDFLLRLNKLKNEEAAETIRPASEACFSLSDMTCIVEARRQKLDTVPMDSDTTLEMKRFLNEDFDPLRHETEARAAQQARESGILWDKPIGRDRATLSPSDFGFHNAMLERTGRTVFLDFEYFGWDDPAKMISDFLLHPAMGLSHTTNRKFLQKVLQTFHMIPQLRERTEIAYSLCALKWCLLLLNEFIPAHRLYREHAGAAFGAEEERRIVRLDNAKQVLGRFCDARTALFERLHEAT